MLFVWFYLDFQMRLTRIPPCLLSLNLITSEFRLKVPSLSQVSWKRMACCFVFCMSYFSFSIFGNSAVAEQKRQSFQQVRAEKKLTRITNDAHRNDKQFWMSDENCATCYNCNAAFHTFRRRQYDIFSSFLLFILLF